MLINLAEATTKSLHWKGFGCHVTCIMYIIYGHYLFPWKLLLQCGGQFGQCLMTSSSGSIPPHSLEM